MPSAALPSLQPTSTRSSSRVTGLDAARVLATLAIVWVHTAEEQGQAASLSTLGRFGTSFYVIAAVFLAARSHLYRPQTRTMDVARKRAKRLLVPYALWCAIYAAFYFSTMYPQGYPISAITRYWGLLFGTAPHLWFLPFAFVAGVLASLSVPRLLKLPGWILITLGLLVTLGAYILVYGWAYPALDKQAVTRIGLHRLDRWLEEIPLVVGTIFGVAIYGRYLPQISRLGRARRHYLVIASLVGFVIVQVAYSVFLDELGTIFWNRVRFFANVAGAFWLVAFVAARRGALLSRLAPLGSATYFAYLAHQLILDSVKTALKGVAGHGSLWFAVLTTLAIFGVAVGLGLLVSRVRALRWLSP